MELAFLIKPTVLYILIGTIYWLISAFVVGFSGNELNKSDFYGSLLWPLSISLIIGQVTRIVMEYFNKPKITKETNVKH